jgi:hypothetical protein
VNIPYADKTIYFFPIFADAFSFYNESLAEGDYNIEKGDWDIEMEVTGIRLSGSGTPLPYGLQIGKQTKEQIIAFYEEDPAFVWEDDLIQYFYYDLDADGNLPEGVDLYATGNISYIFDENYVLKEFLLQWMYYDL